MNGANFSSTTTRKNSNNMNISKAQSNLQDKKSKLLLIFKKKWKIKKELAQKDKKIQKL